MIKAEHNEDDQSWNFFKLFLTELSPIYLDSVNKVLKEVHMIRSGQINYYNISPDYFKLTVWINENYHSPYISYDGLLKVMSSCNRPYGCQTVWDKQTLK